MEKKKEMRSKIFLNNSASVLSRINLQNCNVFPEICLDAIANINSFTLVLCQKSVTRIRIHENRIVLIFK